MNSDDERVYGIDSKGISLWIEPIDSKPNQDDIAIEEAFNPIDSNTEASTSRKFLIALRNMINGFSSFYDKYVETPVSWFFKHVVPRCEHGIR